MNSAIDLPILDLRLLNYWLRSRRFGWKPIDSRLLLLASWMLTRLTSSRLRVPGKPKVPLLISLRNETLLARFSSFCSSFCNDLSPPKGSLLYILNRGATYRIFDTLGIILDYLLNLLFMVSYANSLTFFTHKLNIATPLFTF